MAKTYEQAVAERQAQISNYESRSGREYGSSGLQVNFDGSKTVDGAKYLASFTKDGVKKSSNPTRNEVRAEMYDERIDTKAAEKAKADAAHEARVEQLKTDYQKAEKQSQILTARVREFENNPDISSPYVQQLIGNLADTDRQKELISQELHDYGERPTGYQSVGERAVNVVKSAGKSTVAANMDAQRALYEAGQGARTARDTEEMSQAEKDLARAKQAYEEDYAAYQNGEMSETDMMASKYEYENAQRKYDAFDTVVNDNVQQKATEQVAQEAKNLSESAAQDTEKAKEGLGGAGRFVVDAATGLTQLGMDAALGTVTGLGKVASTMSLVSRAFGGGTMQAKEGGGDIKQQLAYGAAKATVELLTEKIGDGLAGIYGKGAADDLADDIINVLAQTDAGQNALRWVYSAISEGNEELVSSALDPMLQSIYNGKGIMQNYKEADVKEWAYEALVGAATGGVMGGVGIATGNYNARNNDARARFTEGASNMGTALTIGNPADYIKQAISQNATAPTAPQQATQQVTEQIQPTQQAPSAEPSVTANTAPQTQGDITTPPTAQSADTTADLEFNSKPETEQSAETPKTIEERQKALEKRLRDSMAYFEAEAKANGMSDELMERHNAEMDAINAEDVKLRKEAVAEEARQTQNERIENNEVSKAFGTVQNHIDNRTDESVAKPSVKAFQFDYPELHPYFVEAAKQMQQELITATYAINASRVAWKKGAINERNSPIKSLRTFMSIPEIGKCLEDIIANNGQENYANAKRVEIVLDRMMAYGWDSMTREYHEPNAEYRAARDAIGGGMQADSFEQYLKDNELSLIAGEVTEEELRAEWEAQQPKKDAEPESPTQPQTNDTTTASTEAQNTANENSTNPVPTAANAPVTGGANTTGSGNGSTGSAIGSDSFTDYKPQAGEGKVKQMQTPTTAKESEATPEPRKQELEKYIVGGAFNYVGDSNKAQTDRATARIERDGWSKAAADFQTDVEAGRSSADLVALGTVLINNIGNSNAPAAEYMDLTQSLINLMHSTSRALQAGQILQKITPEGRLYMAQREVSKINDMLTDSQKAKISDKSSKIGKDSFKTDEAKEIAKTAKDKAAKKTVQNNKLAKTLEEKLVFSDASIDLRDSKTVIRAVMESAIRSGETTEYIRTQSALGVSNNAIASRIANDLISETKASEAIGSQITDVARKYVGEVLNTDTKTAETRVTTVVKKMLNSIDNKLSQLAVSDKTTKEQAKQDIADMLSIEYSATPESAKAIAETVMAEYDTQLSEAMSDILDKRFGDRDLSGKKKKEWIQGFTEAINLGTFNSEYAQKATEKLFRTENVTIPNKLAEKYINAQTEAERNKVMGEIQQAIADQIPATFADKFTALRYVNMLGNLKTQERNLLGNVLMAAISKAKRSTQAVLEAASGNERNTSMFVPQKLKQQAAADFENVRDVIKGNNKFGDVRTQISQGINDKRTIFNFKPLEAVRKASNFGMEYCDEIFLRFTYKDALGGWMKAHKISDISQMSESQLNSARLFAIKEAQEATFRDYNNVSNLVSQFDKNWDKHGGIGKTAQAVTQGILPFRQTPANVAVRAEEYSPLGLVNTIVKAAQTKSGKTTAADVINSAAKTVIGSALYAAGFLMAAAGHATGGKDDDEKLSSYEKMTGYQDYSVKIGDAYYSYSQFAPMAIPFALGVQTERLLDGELTTDTLSKILGAVTDPLLEMSMLSGVNNAFDNLSKFNGDENALGKFVTSSIINFVGQGLTNALLSQVKQASKGNRQTVYTENGKFIGNDLQYTLGKLAAKTPFVDYNQQDYVDAWGRKQSNGTLGERITNALANPTYSSKDRSTEIDGELKRLYEDNKNVPDFPNVLPKKASRSLEYADGKTMTADEYMQYSIDRGQTSLKLVTEFVQSEEYKDLGDRERADIISDLYSFAADRAMKKIKASHQIEHESDWNEEGLLKSPVDYLVAKKVLSGSANRGSKEFDYELTDKIISGIDELPDDSRELLLNENQNNVGKLYEAYKKGVGSEQYYMVYDSVKSAESEAGNGNAMTKLSGIVSSGADSKTMDYMAESTLGSETLIEYNVLKNFVSKREDIPKEIKKYDPDEDGLEQAELYEAAQKGYPEKVVRALWNAKGYKKSYDDYAKSQKKKKK